MHALMPTLPVARTAELRCPRCASAVERDGERYCCVAAGHTFPIVLGIPDFRLYEDPLIPLADDYRKGEKLQVEAERRTFAELVAYYWTLPTYPWTPPELSARFVHHVLTDDRRIAEYADLLGTGERLLDVGCGAGMLLQHTRHRFTQVTGVDVGFRWLIVARKGLEEAGLTPDLVCACADHLPFADGQFDTVTSVALLEHVPSAPAALTEFARVQRPAGRTLTWTSNRFSLAPEPHVRVWGVGFLPRAWMPAYVRWRRGLAYEKKHLLSRFEFTRAARAAGYGAVRFHLPTISPVDLAHASPAERLGARVYGWVRRIPVLDRLLSIVFPALLAVATRRDPSAARS